MTLLISSPFPSKAFGNASSLSGLLLQYEVVIRSCAWYLCLQLPEYVCACTYTRISLSLLTP